MRSTGEIVLFCVAFAGLSFVYIAPHVFPKKATIIPAAVDDEKISTVVPEHITESRPEKISTIIPAAVDDEKISTAVPEHITESRLEKTSEDEAVPHDGMLWQRYTGRLSIGDVDQGKATFFFNVDKPMHHIKYGEYDEDNDYILDIQTFDYYYDNPTKPTTIRFKIPLIKQKRLYLQQNKGILFYHDGNELFTFKFDRKYRADWPLLAEILKHTTYVTPYDVKSIFGGRSRRRRFRRSAHSRRHV